MIGFLRNIQKVGDFGSTFRLTFEVLDLNDDEIGEVVRGRMVEIRWYDDQESKDSGFWGDCEQCGEPLPIGDVRRRFCSGKCRVAAHRAWLKQEEADTAVTDLP